MRDKSPKFPVLPQDKSRHVLRGFFTSQLREAVWVIRLLMSPFLAFFLTAGHFPHSLILLPGITSQINYPLPSPCLRLCWGVEPQTKINPSTTFLNPIPSSISFFPQHSSTSYLPCSLFIVYCHSIALEYKLCEDREFCLLRPLIYPQHLDYFLAHSRSSISICCLISYLALSLRARTSSNTTLDKRQFKSQIYH